MHLCSQWTAASLAALTLVAAMTSMPAAADPQQTVITARRPTPMPRVDVQTACPDIAETLNRELTPAIVMLGKEGTVRVEFRLQGDQVWDVVWSGGPREYRQPIRSALSGFSCNPGGAGDRFVFAIRFDLQPAAPGPQRLAQLGTP